MATPAQAGPDVVAGQGSVWAELRAAIRGTGADYTRIPLKRAVFLLAVPMVLELVLESTFAVVDIFFVAKLGLKELRRTENEGGRFTLVFLGSGAEGDAAQIEQGRGAGFHPP